MSRVEKFDPLVVKSVNKKTGMITFGEYKPRKPRAYRSISKNKGSGCATVWPGPNHVDILFMSWTSVTPTEARRFSKWLVRAADYLEYKNG